MPNATKPEVKAAVEAMFKVEVESVQIANVNGKKKRFGRYRRPASQLEEGVRVPEAGPGNQLRGGEVDMPLVKSQTDIAGTPRGGQGRQSAPAQGTRRSTR